MATGKNTRAVAKETSMLHKKDWKYLEGKDPQETHVLFHNLQIQKLGRDSDLVLTPRQWMSALAMHRALQASPENQSRDEFRGRTVGSVLAGAETLAENNSRRSQEELLTAMDPAKAKAQAKANYQVLLENAEALDQGGMHDEAESVRANALAMYGDWLDGEAPSIEELREAAKSIEGADAAEVDRIFDQVEEVKAEAEAPAEETEAPEEAEAEAEEAPEETASELVTAGAEEPEAEAEAEVTPQTKSRRRTAK